MAKYVVKNESGEYLCQRSGPSFWDVNRDDRWSTSNRAAAFERARRVFGHVHRVRNVSARREREAIVEHLRQSAKALPLPLARERLDAANEIESLEHRRKHAER